MRGRKGRASSGLWSALENVSGGGNPLLEQEGRAKRGGGLNGRASRRAPYEFEKGALREHL